MSRIRGSAAIVGATGLLVFVLTASAAASPAVLARAKTGSLPSLAQLEAALDADGFQIMRSVTYNGSRGIEAVSRNVTLLSSGEHKRIRYVEGSGYEMGRLRALLNVKDMGVMCHQYVDHIIPSLLSWKFDQKARRSKTWGGLYNATAALLGNFLRNGANKAFAAQPSGTYPQALLDEMHGIADAAAALNASTVVTFKNLVTLNVGLDWLTALVVSGKLIGRFQEYVAEQPEGELMQAVGRDFSSKQELLEALTLLEPTDVNVPSYCDAFAAKGASTASGSGSYYARSFQLPTADVFQDIQTMVIFNPTDGRNALVAATGPGLVGAITAMNSAGFAAGVDTLRSGESDPDTVGMDSQLLVRAMADSASTSAEAVEIAANAFRGCAYLYSLSDKNGNGIIIEAGKTAPGTVAPDTTSLITNDTLKQALPSGAFLAKNSIPDYRNGVYVRNMSYELPQAFIDYNKQLFELAGLPYNASRFGPDGAIFDSYAVENELWPALGSRYFSPQRDGKGDVILVSNFAVTPQMRISQMTWWASLFPGAAMQYRYDLLHQNIMAQYGQIDMDVAREIITFLSPDRTPGYWNNTLDPTNPMSAEIEGILSLVDLQAGVFESKGGYWADSWMRVTLPGYLA